MADSVRRGSFRIFFGEGAEQWSMADPGHPLVDHAQRWARYSKELERTESSALVLSSVAADMAYLVYTCPSTTLACQKLAALRAAVRSAVLRPEPSEGADSTDPAAARDACRAHEATAGCGAVGCPPGDPT